MDEIFQMNLLQVSSLIRKKELSPVEITKRILSKIENENNTYNAFITVMRDTALKDAEIAERDILNGHIKGPLHGVPLAIKDNISVKDFRCTNGSLMDKDNRSGNDATFVKQLRFEGAIIIGKTNLDEFANHVVGKNKHYGTIQNPLNSDYTVGGSSGGSAVSVATNLAYGAFGTDTSGSVRIPAACCGIVGLKPSYNLIPTSGVTPLSWSIDHVGMLAKDCDDLSALFQSVVPGSFKREEFVPTALNMEQLTIGMPENYFFEMIDPTVEMKIKEVIHLCEKHGATIKKVHFEKMERAMNAQETIIGAESAYFHKNNLEEHKELYEKDNYEYFKHGLTISHKDYCEALSVRNEMKRDFQEVFDRVDVLLTPTLPVTAPKLTTEKISWEGYEEDILITLSRFTGPFNVSGLPALSVPVGFNKDGLSIGLQIVGNMYRENQLLSVGKWIMDNV